MRVQGQQLRHVGAARWKKLSEVGRAGIANRACLGRGLRPARRNSGRGALRLVLHDQLHGKRWVGGQRQELRKVLWTCGANRGGLGRGLRLAGPDGGQSAAGLELHDLRRAGSQSGLQSGELQSSGARNNLQRLGRQRRLEGDQIGQFDVAPQRGSARSHDGLLEVVGSIRKRLDGLPRRQRIGLALLAAMGGCAVQLRQILTERIGMQGVVGARIVEVNTGLRPDGDRVEQSEQGGVREDRVRHSAPGKRLGPGDREAELTRRRDAALVERAPELWGRGHSRVCAIIARAARCTGRQRHGWTGFVKRDKFASEKRAAQRRWFELGSYLPAPFRRVSLTLAPPPQSCTA